MKRLVAAILSLVILLSMAVSVSAAPNLPTKDFDGKTYYCVNTKAQYTSLVNYAIDNLLEEMPIYYESDKVEYDTSWSNNVLNFCDYRSYREFKFLDYNANSVSGYCSTKPIFDELNVFTGQFTKEAYGTLSIMYDDTKEEIKKAEGIISGILAQVSGKSQVEKIEHIVNYVCSVAQGGSTKLPDGGYDLINGVYDVLTGYHTNVVCTSYAVTLQKIFEQAGIEAVMIHNVAHIWNMVCIDGVWYGIDATAGDEGSSMSGEYMLMGYDRLKGFDFDDQTPIATFKSRHKLADKNYYNTSGTTASKPITTSPSTSKPTATTPSENDKPSSNNTSSIPSDNSSQEITSEESPATTPEEKEVEIDIREIAIVSADIFKTAKENGEKISLVGNGYSWSFSSNDIKDNPSAESFNAQVFVGDAVPEEAITAVESATKDNDQKVYPFSFSHHGKLPGVADITIEVEPELKGKTVYIYYLDDKNKPVASGKGIVAEDGTLTFTTDHCSVWFLSEEKIANSSNTLLIVLIIVGVLLIGAGVTTFILLEKKKAEK